MLGSFNLWGYDLNSLLNAKSQRIPLPKVDRIPGYLLEQIEEAIDFINKNPTL